MEIFYHSKFIRQYRKLPDEIKSLVKNKEDIFKGNPFDLRLKTHKLHGKLSGCLSFSVSFKYRIIFKYTEDEKDVRFYYIGNHDIYE